MQTGLGHSPLLRKAFEGRRLPVRHSRSQKSPQQARILSAITTQRLKTKSARQGTQRLAPRSKPNAPKRTGTQQLRQPSVGTQVNRKVLHCCCLQEVCPFLTGQCTNSSLLPALQLQSIAAFGEKGTGFRPRKMGTPRAAPTLLSRYARG